MLLKSHRHLPKVITNIPIQIITVLSVPYITHLKYDTKITTIRRDITYVKHRIHYHIQANGLSKYKKIYHYILLRSQKLNYCNEISKRDVTFYTANKTYYTANKTYCVE